MQNKRHDVTYKTDLPSFGKKSIITSIIISKWKVALTLHYNTVLSHYIYLNDNYVGIDWELERKKYKNIIKGCVLRKKI